MITVQSGGRFGFNIVPKCPDADYDWALFDLTNATCADITTNPSLLVSCNYRGATFPTPTTGMNDGPNPQDEDMINVTAGKVYALIVNNFSGIGQCGYVLDFQINDGLPNASTADIIDDVPPVLIADQSTPFECGTKTVSFCFSEYVKCSTVLGNKFRMITPQGDTIKGVSVSSKACSQGSKREKCFTVTLEKPVYAGGNYLFQSFGSIEDLCGNIAAPANITYKLPQIKLSFTTTPVDCALKNATASASVLSGGQSPYSFSWKTTPVQNSQTATGLQLGKYYLTVTDVKGCYSNDSVEIKDRLPSIVLSLSSTPEVCSSKSGTAIATISSGGTAPFSYTWNTSPVQTTSTATGLASGKYKLKVTDSKGCIADDSVIVQKQNINIQLNISSTPVNCTLKDGSASVNVQSGGSPPYSYNWFTNPPQNTASISGLDEGTYKVRVTDAQGCFSEDSVKLVNQVPKIVLAITSTPVSCISNDGTATVSVNSGGIPPFTYSWNTNPPQTANTANNLGPGSYQVTVTDSKGCKENISVSLPDPNNLVLSINTLPDTCSSGKGVATATITGGTSPFQYLWSGSSSQSSSAKDLKAGQQDIEITDSKGCKINKSFTIADSKDIKAFFTFNPSDPNVLSPLVNFINATSNSIQNLWNFGTGDTSSIANPQYLFPALAISYNVSLIVKSPNGCIDSITKKVTIQNVYTLYAPDSFSPNEDDLNDTFRIYVSGIDNSSYTFSVFNRWGNELFRTEDVNVGWNGKINNTGSYCPSGMYVYRVSFLDLTGKRHVVHGRIFILG